MTSVRYGSKTCETTALVFVSDHSESDWGWWCPVCTPPDGPTVEAFGFLTRAYENKAANRHEKAFHNG